MSAQLLDGRLVSDSLLTKVRRGVQKLKRKKITPKLVIILVGDNPASLSYIKQKVRAAEQVGMSSEEVVLPAKTSQKTLLALIEKLNKDKKVHGILVQLPLPAHLKEEPIIRAIDPNKDVDGFHMVNLGEMFISPEGGELSPCTPSGIIEMLNFYGLPLEGQEVVVVGRSNIVGKPVATMLINKGATVTVCHSKTRDLTLHTKRADILIVAVGRPGLITARMVKPGAVVVDVGTSKVDNKLVGDVDFKAVSRKAAWISPVPGGVGPMTVACLMRNVLRAAERLSASKAPSKSR